jgi:hypothetical protein
MPVYQIVLGACGISLPCVRVYLAVHMVQQQPKAEVGTAVLRNNRFHRLPSLHHAGLSVHWWQVPAAQYQHA